MIGFTSAPGRVRRGAIAATASLAVAGSVLGFNATHAAAGPDEPEAFQGEVLANGGLAERAAPSRHAQKSGPGYPKGAIIDIECQLNGSTVRHDQRWFKIAGRDSWVSGRYVMNIGDEAYACTAGDWAYQATEQLIVRAGPSLRDRRTGVLAEGEEFNTRWITAHGQAVDGDRTWLAVESPDGNIGWVSNAYVRLIG